MFFYYSFIRPKSGRSFRVPETLLFGDAITEAIDDIFTTASAGILRDSSALANQGRRPLLSLYVQPRTTE